MEGQRSTLSDEEGASLAELAIKAYAPFPPHRAGLLALVGANRTMDGKRLMLVVEIQVTDGGRHRMLQIYGEDLQRLYEAAHQALLVLAEEKRSYVESLQRSHDHYFALNALMADQAKRIKELEESMRAPEKSGLVFCPDEETQKNNFGVDEYGCWQTNQADGTREDADPYWVIQEAHTALRLMKHRAENAERALAEMRSTVGSR